MENFDYRSILVDSGTIVHCKDVLWNEEQKRRMADCQGCQLQLTIEKRCIIKQHFLHFVCHMSLWEAIKKSWTPEASSQKGQIKLGGQ